VGGGEAEGHDTGEAEHIHLHHLDEIGHGARMLEGMRGIGVEDATAIGAELLDRLLARHREEGDGLAPALERFNT
jgi:hypothetical protein